MICVSVIVPYFKKRNFIKKTINSIKCQTYKNLEIIIIYDDENRADLHLIKKIKNSDKRIKLIINKKSIGAGPSRNVGIKKAKAKYVAFIDSDDLWMKNKIELQLKYMVKNKLKICHTAYRVLDNYNNKKIMYAKTFKNYKQLLLSCDIGLSTVMMKKNLITKNCKFPNLKTKEDFTLWLLILKKKITIGSLNKCLTNWRKLNNSLSSSILQKLRDGFILYNVFMKYSISKSIWYLLMLSINSLKK